MSTFTCQPTASPPPGSSIRQSSRDGARRRSKSGPSTLALTAAGATTEMESTRADPSSARASPSPRSVAESGAPCDSSEMAELVRVSHDAHGLDPAFDDIHRENAPDPDLGLLLGCGPSRSGAGGVAGVLHERGELLRVDVA
jgi:hypothetical protein